jgi:hypothetical protein
LSEFVKAIAIFSINHHKNSIGFRHRQRYSAQSITVENSRLRSQPRLWSDDGLS